MPAWAWPLPPRAAPSLPAAVSGLACAGSVCLCRCLRCVLPDPGSSPRHSQGRDPSHLQAVPPEVPPTALQREEGELQVPWGVWVGSTPLLPIVRHTDSSMGTHGEMASDSVLEWFCAAWSGQTDRQVVPDKWLSGWLGGGCCGGALKGRFSLALSPCCSALLGAQTRGHGQ